MTMADNDEPIDMSDFRLGPRYSSEDMYRDFPRLRPGDMVAVEADGQLYTDVVSSIRYTSATPGITRRLSLLGRIVRRLTPGRFRRSLVIRPARPARTIVTMGPHEDEHAHVERARETVQRAADIIDSLRECGPLDEYRGQ